MAQPFLFLFGLGILFIFHPTTHSLVFPLCPTCELTPRLYLCLVLFLLSLCFFNPIFTSLSPDLPSEPLICSLTVPKKFDLPLPRCLHESVFMNSVISVCLSVSLSFPRLTSIFRRPSLPPSRSPSLPPSSSGSLITFVLFLQPVEGDSGVGRNASRRSGRQHHDAWLPLGKLLQRGAYSTPLPRQEMSRTQWMEIAKIERLQSDA